MFFIEILVCAVRFKVIHSLCEAYQFSYLRRSKKKEMKPIVRHSSCDGKLITCLNSDVSKTILHRGLSWQTKAEHRSRMTKVLKTCFVVVPTRFLV